MGRDRDDLPAGIRAAYRSGRIDDDRPDEPSSDPSISVRWSIVAQVVGYVLGLFTVYNLMTSRLTALETQRALDSQRMERMENKIDRLLERDK